MSATSRAGENPVPRVPLSVMRWLSSLFHEIIAGLRHGSEPTMILDQVILSMKGQTLLLFIHSGLPRHRLLQEAQVLSHRMILLCVGIT